jgi:hypothetical protein
VPQVYLACLGSVSPQGKRVAGSFQQGFGGRLLSPLAPAPPERVPRRIGSHGLNAGTCVRTSALPRRHHADPLNTPRRHQLAQRLGRSGDGPYPAPTIPTAAVECLHDSQIRPCESHAKSDLDPIFPRQDSHRRQPPILHPRHRPGDRCEAMGARDFARKFGPRGSVPWPRLDTILRVPLTDSGVMWAIARGRSHPMATTRRVARPPGPTWGEDQSTHRFRPPLPPRSLS